jgi:spermidine/putrescine-binding protein
VNRHVMTILLLLTVILFSGSCAKRAPTLNLLVWEGYADPSFVKAFEDQYHCKVSASYMGSSDELVAKLRGGSAGNYDIISPSSDVATSIATAGLSAPLDLTKIPGYSQLSPQLTSSGAGEWSGLRCAVHVGARSADLRRDRFCQAA